MTGPDHVVGIGYLRTVLAPDIDHRVKMFRDSGTEYRVNCGM